MTRYKLTIEYKGTNFIGWQKQKEGYSIQGTIEKADPFSVNTSASIVGLPLLSKTCRPLMFLIFAILY